MILAVNAKHFPFTTDDIFAVFLHFKLEPTLIILCLNPYYGNPQYLSIYGNMYEYKSGLLCNMSMCFIK